MTHIIFGTDMFFKQIYIGLSVVIIIATFLNIIIVSKLSTNCTNVIRQDLISLLIKTYKTLTEKYQNYIAGINID